MLFEIIAEDQRRRVRKRLWTSRTRVGSRRMFLAIRVSEWKEVAVRTSRALTVWRPKIYRRFS
jgi:hypothetical protein